MILSCLDNILVVHIWNEDTVDGTKIYNLEYLAVESWSMNFYEAALGVL